MTVNQVVVVVVVEEEEEEEERMGKLTTGTVLMSERVCRKTLYAGGRLCCHLGLKWPLGAL